MDANENGILYAYALDGQGGGKPLAGGDVSKIVKADDLAWVHFDMNQAGTRKWITTELSYLDDIIIDALLAEETRPRILEMDEGALLILRGVNLNENAAPEDMVSIRLWIDSKRIISVRRRKLKAVMDMRERLEQGKGPKSAGDFITMLSSRLFERMEPVLSDLDDRTDEIEERVIDDPDVTERQDIIAIRKQAILLRRYIAPQRDVIATLRTSEQPWLDAPHKRRLQESFDRLTRYVEDLDAIRERAQIIKDELANALSDRLNRNMYVLSVVAAIFLPLGFLTGLLGINVGGMPGADNDSAFWIFTGGLSILIAIQVAIFKKLKWF